MWIDNEELHQLVNLDHIRFIRVEGQKVVGHFGPNPGGVVILKKFNTEHDARKWFKKLRGVMNMDFEGGKNV